MRLALPSLRAMVLGSTSLTLTPTDSAVLRRAEISFCRRSTAATESKAKSGLTSALRVTMSSER